MTGSSANAGADCVAQSSVEMLPSSMFVMIFNVTPLRMSRRMLVFGHTAHHHTHDADPAPPGQRLK